MKFAVICLLGVLMSCSNKNPKKVFSLEKDGFHLKGFIKEDSSFVDTLFYFDNRNKIVRKEFYKHGMLENHAFDYYTDGTVQIITSYSKGLRNGRLSYFDSLGNCIYSEFYYYDLQVGPVIWYNTSGDARTYDFKNLQGETFFSLFYDGKLPNMESLAANSINYSYTIQRRIDSRRGSLLLYLLSPPKMDYKYLLFERINNKPSDYRFIDSLNSNLPFKHVYLPLTNDSSQFVIGLKIFDSVSNRGAMIYKDVTE